MKDSAFKSAFAKTMLHEGEYSFDRMDTGGETFLGISRVYWPGWEGWPIFDRALSKNREMSTTPELLPMVRNFYRENFWNRFRGEDIAELSVPVAQELFDTAVNLGVHKASKYLQDALNLLNDNQGIYPDMVVDGQIGVITLDRLRLFFDLRPLPREKKEEMLLNLMNVLQGGYYVEKMRAHPEKERWRGWFLRV